MGAESLLIPRSIRDLAWRFPSAVACNDISEELAEAVIANDMLIVKRLERFDGLVHDQLLAFLQQIPEKETVLVHFYRKGKYYTAVINFSFKIGQQCACASALSADPCVIIAVARIPQKIFMPEKCLRDEFHIAINNMTRKAYA